ncbi:WD domain, G-beta repeat [Popillia japonica]|uniref:WD domain, G-beta repeat n=1 Tax=Popillia japonica TaxID=7064 RepID=A0AAW1KP01_POPJA
MIKAYKRLNNKKIDVHHYLHVLSGNNLSDISRFIKRDNCLVSGQSDGALWVWTKQGNKITTTTEKHQKEVVSVDIHNNLIVSGSRDCTFKLWNCRNNYTEISPIHTSYVADRLWSTSFNESGLSLAIGTSGCNDRAALKIFDVHSLLETYSLGGEFQKGAGILDMKWDTDNILLACGYDSCVRRWDLRTGKCVQCWEDPFYATIYCLDIDKMCTLIIGTQNNGRVVLFDTRQTKYTQMYFMQTCRMRGRNSPAYSLSFDATQLFIATDQHLHILDFTDKRAKIHNYSDL